MLDALILYTCWVALLTHFFLPIFSLQNLSIMESQSGPHCGCADVVSAKIKTILLQGLKIKQTTSLERNSE